MGVRSFNPITPSLRKTTMLDFSELTTNKSEPVRKLVRSLHGKGGRNNHGHIAVRFRGGGHKRRYRVIDMKRNKLDIPAKVIAIEYDPNRSANIALVQYADGAKNYILAPVGLTKDSTILAGEKADIQPGHSLELSRIPAGTFVHAVELKPGKGAQMARSAGSSVQIMAREGGYVLLRLPSGELRKVLESCKATVGQVGNVEYENINIGKAGRSRWLGRLPHNRGVTMNPVDHPHGGGEGKTSGGRHPVTPWGQPTRGYKTRKNTASNRYIVARRPKKNKSR